ncbi:MAG: hypothetical protein NXH90_06270 [Flavobacteriaceae bacterium]|nr:hypothetical protein [Flavobacteriaceae bacterium]
MDKLEKHIKEKLEERTIAPSKGAWDKIASQVEQKPQYRNKWFSYAIAASVVGIVLVSVFFFTKDGSEMEQPQVVETNVKIEEETPSAEKSVKEFVPSEQKTKVAVTGVELKKPAQNEGVQQSTSNATVADRSVKEPLQGEIKINSDKLIAQKVGEVVAQVQIMENAKQNVTDAEVDSLLRAAQRQILSDKLFAESGSVDAMSLLAEVEGELDESFRDQIFDALKSGYLKIRTAVADRNQ